MALGELYKSRAAAATVPSVTACFRRTILNYVFAKEAAENAGAFPLFASEIGAARFRQVQEFRAATRPPGCTVEVDVQVVDVHWLLLGLALCRNDDQRRRRCRSSIL
jgi:hypothetical protein